MFLPHLRAMDMNCHSTEPVPSAAQASLERLRSVIAIASGLMISGRAVDLAGLESVAGLLCAQVLDLPPEQGRAFRPSLVLVQESVANLAATLTASRS